VCHQTVRLADNH